MTKFTKLTVSAIVALLVICLSSTTFAQYDTPAPSLPVPSGLPIPTGEDGATTDSATPTSSTSDDGSYGVPSGVPSGLPSGYPSGVPSGVPSGAPSASGSVAAELSSIFGKYSSTQGAPPAYSPAPTDVAKAAPPVGTNSANKIENGLISGVIIAGIINLFI